MTFVFGTASRERMKGLHPELVRVIERALQLSDIDFTIMEGVRTHARQLELYAQGRTKPGNVVTWTTHSNHEAKKDGFGYAVDIYPYPVSSVFGKRASEYEPLFDKIAAAMFKASKELGIPIRWGANWDMDNMPRERGESDNPHFELHS